MAAFVGGAAITAAAVHGARIQDSREPGRALEAGKTTWTSRAAGDAPAGLRQARARQETGTNLEPFPCPMVLVDGMVLGTVLANTAAAAAHSAPAPATAVAAVAAGTPTIACGGPRGPALEAGKGPDL